MSRILSKRVPLAAALGSTALVGAWLGLSAEAVSPTAAVSLPLVVLFTGLISAPALYIGSAVVKAAPSPVQVVRGLADGLDHAGLALLGLLPALLFLGATNASSAVALFLGLAAVGGSMVFGLRLMFSRLFATPEVRLRVLPVFGAWALVTLGIGLMMLLRALEVSL